MTILANETTATIDVAAAYDAVLEPNETVIVTLTEPIASGDEDITVNSTPATVTISDDSVVTLSIAPVTPTINESQPGQFAITLSDPRRNRLYDRLDRQRRCDRG